MYKCLIVRKTMPSTPGDVSIAIDLIDFSIESSATENGVKFWSPPGSYNSRTELLAVSKIPRK